MRVKQISVTNLFGIFNHIVPLNLEERITIIHGKNGFGKTALLRLVNGLFNYRYSELNSIYFESFQIAFDNSNYLQVNKSTKKDIDAPHNHLTIDFKNHDGTKSKPFSFDSKVDAKELGFPLSLIDSIIPGIERMSATTWLYIPTNEKLSLSEILERFEQFLPTVETKVKKQPEWLRNVINSIDIRFIESQRLLNLYSNGKQRIYTKQTSMIPSVTTYANELAKNIQAKLAEYGTLAQSLDRTFPARVVQQKASTDLIDEEIRHKLNVLEEKRSHLINAGLLDRDEDPNFQVKEQIDDSTKKVLLVYVEDVEKKLSVFEDLAERIDIFRRIINQRFSYKQINISKNKGFTFTCNGNSLSPTDLSSGEQHELVILYELLFKVKPNSLILIDEPELSLHVEWQVQFIKDLQEITKIANLDVLMATHSPDLIHDRWDLTVQLKGPLE